MDVIVKLNTNYYTLEILSRVNLKCIDHIFLHHADLNILLKMCIIMLTYEML